MIVSLGMTYFVEGDAATGTVGVERFADRSLAECRLAESQRKYKFVVGNMEEMGHVPLLLLVGMRDKLTGTTSTGRVRNRNKLEKEVWKAMENVEQVAANDAKAQKKAEAAEKKAAREAAKAAKAAEKAAQAQAKANAKAEKERLAAEKKAEREAAKANKPKSNAGRKSEFDPTEVITILSDGNPKREGTASHARFALYSNGMTVESALAVGVKAEDLRWDLGRRYISIAKAS